MLAVDFRCLLQKHITMDVSFNIYLKVTNVVGYFSYCQEILAVCAPG